MLFVAPLAPLLGLVTQWGWWVLVGEPVHLQHQHRRTLYDALPWLGCAATVLLMLAVLTSRTVTATRRAEGELLVSLPLAVLVLMLAEKLRWFIGFFLPWAAGPAPEDLLGSLFAERRLVDPKLAVPASVLAGVWILIAWLRIERTREAALATLEPSPGDVGGAG